jgi:type III pantothenate kinase
MDTVTVLSAQSAPILLVDAGNTWIKLALLSCPYLSNNLGAVYSISHDASAQEWDAALESCGVAIRAEHPLPVLCSSVVNTAANTALQAQIHRFCGGNLIWQHWKNKPLPQNFFSIYESPGLGSDRLLAALAARRTWPQTDVMVLASFGTATTVDTIVQSRYCGGLIAPGITLMAHSLSDNTANLRLQNGETVAVPTNTADAIHTAIIAAQLGCIEYALRAARQLQQSATDTSALVVTGGGLSLIAKHLPPHQILPNAVLQGLAVIACETNIFTAS